MDEREAWAVLGLRPGATRAQARAAYRDLVRRHHPDVAVAGAGAGGSRTTARVNEAWRVVQAVAVDGPTLAPGAPGADTIVVEAPADEAFLLLLEAAHRVGDVTHVSPGDGLLEALVAFDDGRTCSLVISLQGRGNGTTEAFCTLQALDARPSPPVGLVVDELLAVLQSQ